MDIFYTQKLKSLMKVGDLVNYKSPMGLDYEGKSLRGIIVKIDVESGNGVLYTVLCHDNTVRHFFINELTKI